MKKFFTSIGGIWIILTLFYLILNLILATTDSEFAFHVGLAQLIKATGIFVPYGFYNSLSILKFPLVFLFGIGGIAFVHFMMSKLQLKTFARIIVSLVCLLLLTLVVDMSIWHKWCSGESLIDSTTIFSCGSF